MKTGGVLAEKFTCYGRPPLRSFDLSLLVNEWDVIVQILNRSPSDDGSLLKWIALERTVRWWCVHGSTVRSSSFRQLPIDQMTEEYGDIMEVNTEKRAMRVLIYDVLWFGQPSQLYICCEVQRNNREIPIIDQK